MSEMFRSVPQREPVLARLPVWFYLAAVYATAMITALAVTRINQPVYLIIAAVALPVIALAFFRSDFALLLLLFMTFTRTFEVLLKNDGALSPYTFYLVFLVFALVIRRTFYKEEIKGWQTAAVLYGLFGLMALGSALYAYNPDVVIQQTILYLKDAIMAMLIVILLRDAITLRQAVWALLAAAIFLGGITVFQQISGTTNQFFGFGVFKVANIYEDVQGSRLGGPRMDPNAYGRVMLVLLPLAWDRFWNEKKALLRALAIIAFTLITLTLIFTYSRSNFLILVLVLGLLWLSRPNRLKTLLIGGLVMALVLPLVPQAYTQRLDTLRLIVPGGGISSDPTEAAFQQASSEISFRGRLSENLVGILMSRDHPVLGVGYGNYKENYQSYSRTLGLDPRRETRAAHNLYLEISSEFGILGLVWLFLLNWMAFRGLNAARIKFHNLGKPEYAGIAVAMMIGLVALLSSSLFLHNVYPRYFWMFYAIALAIPNTAEAEADRQFIESAFQKPSIDLMSGTNHA